jgi:enamine deaminase RidA (YjgF/YER057c/UK114 family)
MRVLLSLSFLLLPAIAFAQVKRSNPPTLSKPTGYTHVVEVPGPALAAAGAKFTDVVKMNTYVTDMDKAPAVREVRAKYFAETTPASTLVQVVKLARPEFMLEIEVVAAVPAK